MAGSRSLQPHDSFLSRVYEAAVAPEFWPSVLADLATIAGLRSAVLFAANGNHVRWIATPEFDSSVNDFFARYAGENERTKRLIAAQRAGFVRDADVFDGDEVEKIPAFRDFLIPRGYGSGVATAISSPSGDAFIYHAEGPYADGPVSRRTVAQLDRLRPHLARAALISARLEMQAARGAAEALGAIGLPAAVLGRRRSLLAANEPFNALIPGAVLDLPSGIALTERGANKLLQMAIDSVASAASSAPNVYSIPLPARSERPPLILHLVPVRRSAHDVFVSGEMLVVVTPVVPKKIATADVLQGLFDLTPAEARVARAIGEGKVVDCVATTLGLSRETVRTQLRAVFSKTGVERQADLLALLSGTRLPQ